MKVDNDLIRHFDSVYKRLSSIRRFNATCCIVPENVAAHSFFVTYITMILCDIVNDECLPQVVDTEICLRIALVHDVEESMSGDILANMKTENAGFRRELEIINLNIMKKIYASDTRYIKYWRKINDREDLEGRLVKLADRVALCCYSGNEARLGNMDIVGPFLVGVDRIEDIASNSFPALRGITECVKEYFKRWI